MRTAVQPAYLSVTSCFVVHENNNSLHTIHDAVINYNDDFIAGG